MDLKHQTTGAQESPFHSLVIAPQWIGDAVMTEPLLRELAAHQEKLTVAALPWVAPVYRAMPQVEKVIELPFRHGGLQWQARKQLGQSLQGQFQAAYVLPNSFKSALIPFWAGIEHRIGYRGEMRWGLINRYLPNPSKTHRPPMVEFYSALAPLSPRAERPALWASISGISEPKSTETSTTSYRSTTVSTLFSDAGNANLDSSVSSQRYASLNKERYPVLSIKPLQQQVDLAQYELTAKTYYVFAPGAEFGPAKRWPATHFAALLSALDAPVIILGSAKESELAAQIIQLATGPMALQAQNLAGKTSLDEALSIIANAKAVASNDSGLMHVAASFSVPQVAVYGSSSPFHTPPLNPRAAVLWLKTDTSYQPVLDCAPCFQRECSFGHTRCLNDITPGSVQQALLQLV